MDYKLDKRAVLVVIKQYDESGNEVAISNINIPQGIEDLPAFERLASDVVLIDGKYYQQMTDEQSASFIWGETG